MADFDWPDDLAPFAQSFWLQPHVGRSESPFTRQQKIYGLSAPRWVTRLSMRGGYDNGGGLRDVGGRMDALIEKLEGGFNRVRLWDFRRPNRTGPGRALDAFNSQTLTFDGGETFGGGESFLSPALDPPTNEAALAGATEMTWSGFEPGTLIFKPGDYVGGDGRPHRVLDPAYANDDGEVTVSFKLPLGADVAEGAGIFAFVSSYFRLTADDAGANLTEVGQASLYDIELIEDL